MVITEYIESPKYESMRKNLKNVEYLNKDISESQSNEIKNGKIFILQFFFSELNVLYFILLLLIQQEYH